MSRARSSPRKFSEKIALLNKKEAEHNAEFEKIIKEVELTTRAQSSFPVRTSSFSNCYSNYPDGERRPVEMHHLSSNYNYNSHQVNTHHEISNNLQPQRFFSSQHQLYTPSPGPIISQSPEQHQNHIHLQHHQNSHHYQQQQQHHHDQTSLSNNLLQPMTNNLNDNHQRHHQPHYNSNNNIHDHHSQSTPANFQTNCQPMTNIEIAIDDSFLSDQQVDYVYDQPSPVSPINNNNNHIILSSPAHHNQLHHVSSTISAARSLPDIANLRVTSNSPSPSSLCEPNSPVIMPSYSAERLNIIMNHNDTNDNSQYASLTYEPDPNIIPESVLQTDLSCSSSKEHSTSSAPIHITTTSELTETDFMISNNSLSQEQIPMMQTHSSHSIHNQNQNSYQELQNSNSPTHNQSSSSSWQDNFDCNSYYIQQNNISPQNDCSNGYLE